MVNDDNEAVYCKFHYKTDQGIKCFDRWDIIDDASKAGSNGVCHIKL